MAVQCLDDPGTIHQKEWCLSAVSKELKGTLTNVEHKAHQCHTPPCKTLKTVHQVKIAASTHAPLRLAVRPSVGRSHDHRAAGDGI
jgi:hypothetical protein